MTNSFASSFEAWLSQPEPRDAQIENELRAQYRAAWEGGDLDDRYAVLSFIYWNRERSGFDLLFEALRDGNAGLAQHAACNAWALLTYNVDLDINIRGAFQDFERRYPDWKSISHSAIELLEHPGVQGEGR